MLYNIIYKRIASNEALNVLGRRSDSRNSHKKSCPGRRVKVNIISEDKYNLMV